MFMIDYKQELTDHAKVTVLIKNFEPLCNPAVFDQFVKGLRENYAVIHPKSLQFERMPQRFSRTKHDSLVQSSVDDTHSDLGHSSQAVRQKPLRLRYVSSFYSSNNALSSFQAHRATLGLIGLCCCRSVDQIQSAIQGYLAQKAIISEIPIQGRLFLLIPLDELDGNELSMDEATSVIVDECQKNLYLNAAEILAHPAEQIFNEDITRFHQQSTVSRASSGFDEPTNHRIPTIRFKRPCSVAHNHLALNPRLAACLVEMTTQIHEGLEKTIRSFDPNAMLSPRSTVSLDISQATRSESGIMDSSSINTVSMGRTGSNASLDVNTKVNKPQTESGVIKQITGVLEVGKKKKRLADIALQLGELDLAQSYYEKALQSLNANLWIAGAREGLCAVAVVRDMIAPTHSTSGLLMPPMHTNLRHSLTNLANLSNSDLVLNKPVPLLKPGQVCEYALEALGNYRKAPINAQFLEETTFKIIRLLIMKKQSKKAGELLDSIFSTAWNELEGDEIPNQVHRLSTLIELYESLGLRRRAGLVAWSAFKQNLNLIDSIELNSLLPAVHISYVPAHSFLQTLDHLGDDSSEQSLLTHKQPAIPTSVSPHMVRIKEVWFRGSTGAHRFRKDKQKSAKPRSFHRTSRKSVQVKTHIRFVPKGWIEIQLTVVCAMIERFKKDWKFEDLTEIAWAKGLELIGFMFSLLDYWTQWLDEKICQSIMEDLCRLALLRSPDQPPCSASLLSYQTPDTDSTGQRPTKLWPRARSLFLSPPSSDSPTKRNQTRPKQMVELIQVPVHQLPEIRVINLLSLPNYLIPDELSTNGISNAVPIEIVPQPDKLVFDFSSNAIVRTATARVDMSPGHRSVFFYAPTSSDPFAKSGVKVVDWVCEEPVELELLVNNLLPVELRISELRIEMVQVDSAVLLADSSRAHRVNSQGSPTNVPPATPPVQLVAISVTVEFPNSADSTSRPPPNYSVEMNKSCLLETARYHRLYPDPESKLLCRRPGYGMSFTLPASTSGIRLMVCVVPTSEMLVSDVQTHHDSGPSVLYRICGFSYRLVDFGGMFVSIRVPNSSLQVPQNSTSQAYARQDSSQPPSILEHHASVVSSISSSLLLSCGSPNAESAGSDFSGATHQHPTKQFAERLLLPLAVIRLRPAMPRLCVFPGVVRSAHNLHEASNFLPESTIPNLDEPPPNSSVAENSDKKFSKICPHWFRNPEPQMWSANVASVADISIFPYETRWFPLQLWMRDEAAENVLDDLHDQGLSDIKHSRQLNVFQVTISVGDKTTSLLKQLRLSFTDIIQCFGPQTIQNQLPIELRNRLVTRRWARTKTGNEGDGIDDAEHEESDNSLDRENRTKSVYAPFEGLFCATKCGLVWICVQSEAFWNSLSIALASSEPHPKLNLRSSVKLEFELQFEYAVDVPVSSDPSTPSSLPMTPNLSPIGSGPHAMPLSRRVSIGIQLNLLSSKRSPLLLLNPSLKCEFKDRVIPDMMTPSSLETAHSYPFFVCMLRAVMSSSLFPRPLRFSSNEYCLDIELNHWWINSDSEHKTPQNQVRTAWTSFHKATQSAPSQSRRSSLDSSTSSVLSLSTMNNSSLLQGEIRMYEVATDSADDQFCQLALPLHNLSDLVFSSKHGLKLLTAGSEAVRTDEIFIPLPANVFFLLHLLQSNIGISWKSYLHGRRLSREQEGNSDDLLPDPRFYRFGRLHLGAHYPEIDGSVMRSISRAKRKLWFSDVLSKPANIAQILWCDNFKVELELSNISTQIPKTLDHNQAYLCSVCRMDSNKPSYLSATLERNNISATVKNAKRQTASFVMDSKSLLQNHSPTAAARRASFQERSTSSKLVAASVSDEPVFVIKTCIGVAQALPLLFRGSVIHNPMKGFEYTINNSPDQSDSTMPIELHRSWSLLAVYRIKINCELSPPLVEGEDFILFGSAAVGMGLHLESECKDNLPHDFIVFLKPGKYLIRGLLGLLPRSFTSPSVTTPGQTSIAFPSASIVDAMCLSPNAISVHVLEKLSTE